MGAQALCLGEIGDEGIDVEAYCSQCGESLGRYHYRPWMFFSHNEATLRAMQPMHWTKNGRGPRTQRRLIIEWRDGQVYVRKVCNCGANEKRTESTIKGMPITFRPDGSAVLVF